MNNYLQRKKILTDNTSVAPQRTAGNTVVSQTFKILYRNEEVKLDDHAHFKLHLIVDANKVTISYGRNSIVDANKVTISYGRNSVMFFFSFGVLTMLGLEPGTIGQQTSALTVRLFNALVISTLRAINLMILFVWMVIEIWMLYI